MLPGINDTGAGKSGNREYNEILTIVIPAEAGIQ